MEINTLRESFSFLFSVWLYSPLDLGRFFSFLILYTVARTPWRGDQPFARPLPTHRQHKHRINAHRHPCREWDTNLRPSIRASEDGSCLRPHGHCDRALKKLAGKIRLDRVINQDIRQRHGTQPIG
jgi:hypothetical protein